MRRLGLGGRAAKGQPSEIGRSRRRWTKQRLIVPLVAHYVLAVPAP